MPEDVHAAPRCCRVFRYGIWQWKVRYPTPGLAEARAVEGQEAYRCEHCGTWHLGTPKQTREGPCASSGDA